MRKLVTLIVAMMVLLVPAHAQKVSTQKKQMEKLRSEIAELDKQIKANDSKSADAANRLALTRKKVQAGKELVAQAGKDLDSLKLAVEDKEKAIELASGQLDTTMQAYGKLVRKAYLARDTKMWFVYILTGKSLAKTVRRAAYMKDISTTLKHEAREISERKAALETQKLQLDTLKMVYELILEQRSADLASLKADEATEKGIVDKLKKDQAAYQKKLAKKQKEADALNKKIAEMVAAEARKAAEAKKKAASSSSKKGKSSPKNDADVKLSADFVANKGKLPWPVSGTVVGQYGQHNHPVYKNVALPFNNGVNIATKADAEVKAVFNGEVRQVVVMPGYNQCVLVQHGDYYTFYCKLKDVTVKAGDKVTTGTLLGHVDSISGETQLHFQVWKGTASQDPENWLR